MQILLWFILLVACFFHSEGLICSFTQRATITLILMPTIWLKSIVLLVFSWLDFANEDLWSRLSTWTADMLIANKADAGQAVRLVRLQLKVWSDMAAEAPRIFFLWRFSLRLSHARVLKGSDDLVDGFGARLVVIYEQKYIWKLINELG